MGLTFQSKTTKYNEEYYAHMKRGKAVIIWKVVSKLVIDMH